MHRLAYMALPLLALTLTACGGGRNSQDELMRRVAQAEEAARRSEAAAARAEAAAGGGSPAASEPAPTVIEADPNEDSDFGQGDEPVPEDG